MGGFSSQSGAGNDGLGSVMNADNVCFNGTSRGECVTLDGQLLIGSSSGQRIKPATLTAGSGITITNAANAITISAPGSTTDFHVARYIVSSGGSADGANYTTIASAITAATLSGGVQTIAIQPGTYTENLTWPANINLVAFVADASTPNVTIVGKSTCTDAGARSASGIRFQTNADNFLAVTGTLATVVRLRNCYINCTNATGITFSSSSASAGVSMSSCSGDLGTTGISLYSMTSPGTLSFDFGSIGNSGSSTTASNNSAGTVQISRATLNIPFSTSGTGSISFFLGSSVTTSGTNTTCLALTGTSAGESEGCLFDSGTATAITVAVGHTFSLYSSTIRSSNAAALSGAGTLNYGALLFAGTSSTNTVTTQVPTVFSNNCMKIVTPGAYPYTTTSQDEVILVDTSVARTITPLASPQTGQKHVIKDNVGSAAANNITITPSGKNVDGAASTVINIAYGSATIVYNGTQWNII